MQSILGSTYKNPLLTTGQQGNNTFSKPIVTKNQELGFADSWLANKLQEDFKEGPTDKEYLGRMLSDLQEEIKLESKLVSSNEAEMYKFKSRGYVDENAYTYQDSYSVPSEVKEVLARFGSNTDNDFLTHNAIGDSLNMPSYYGVLILDEAGSYRIGIYDYLTATKLADPDASQLEFISTNASQEWAATQQYLSGRNILTTSPSWATTTKEVPTYDVDPNTGSYANADGTPLKLASIDPSTGAIIPNIPFDPNLFPNPTETTVTPDLVLYVGTNPRTGKDSNEPVMAKDAIPMETRVDRRGLDFYLGDTDYVRSLREYNLAAPNNWARYSRVGNYGLADRSVGLGISDKYSIGSAWIDPTVIPVVDAAAHWFSGFEFGGSGISDPRVVAKKYTPQIPGEEVYNLILEDKPLAMTLTLMGVDLDKIKLSRTSGEVFGYINSALIQNGVSKAIQTRTARDGWFGWAGRGIGTMAYHTLVAGDAVGQTAITALTGGVGTVASGLNVARTSLTTAKNLTTLERLAETASLGTKVNKTKFFGLAWGGMEGFGRALRGVNAALPVNFADYTVSGIGKVLNLRKSRGALTGVETVKQTSKLKKAGSWLLNQSIEGFVEEGFQEFLGQTIDMQKDIRNSYDPYMIWSNAVDGLWAEPLLGGVLYGPSRGQNWIFGKLLKGGLTTQSKILGLNPAKVMEMEHYLSQFYGAYDSMSEAEKTARTKQVMRMVILSDSIERNTVGDLANKEDSAKRISMLIRNVNKASPGSGAFMPEAFAHIEGLVEELNTDYNNPKTTKERKAAIDTAIKEGIIVKQGDRLFLSSDGAADLAALLSIEQTNPDNAERGRVQYLQNKYTESLEKVDPADREKIANELTSNLEFLLKSLSLKATESRTNEFASSEVSKIVSDSIEALKETESGSVTVDDPKGPAETTEPSKPKSARERRDEEKAAKAGITEAAPVAPKAAPVAPEAAPVAPEAAPVAPEAAPVAPEAAPVAPEAAPVVPKPVETKPLGGFSKPAGMTLTTELETTLVSLGQKIDNLDIDISLKNKIKNKINRAILNNKNDLVKLQIFLNTAESNPLDILNAC
jgi:hypothetical protein